MSTPMGVLTISGIPDGAKCRIGSSEWSGPMTVGLTVGAYVLHVELAGHQPVTHELDVTAGSLKTLPIELEPTRSDPVDPVDPADPIDPNGTGVNKTETTRASIVPGVVIIGSGVLCMGGSATLFVLAADDNDKLGTAGVGEFKDLQTSRDTKYAAAWALGGVGVAAVLGGVLYLVFKDGGDDPPEATSGPTVRAVGLSPVPDGAVLNGVFQF